MTYFKIPARGFCHIIFSGVSSPLPLSTSDELSYVFLELSSYCLRLTLVHRLAPRTAPLRCSVSDMCSIKRFKRCEAGCFISDLSEKKVHIVNEQPTVMILQLHMLSTSVLKFH